ncbi:Odorant binding protein 6 [Cephus cinctus]|uniref:General odorant-binding protein 83a n=1 Tax=Cephus cinctus TaxID=211228 RepID=A0A3L9LTS2_CEPCN|nr:general odorant-binding protein 83a [Cephus cinctus]RLZ02132.1 Odorant binding protein 6 [Cephus cinctus]
MLLYVCCVFFLLGFGNSHGVSDEMMEMAKMLHDSCVSETGVDEGLIEKCRDGVFTEDSNLKCYIKCIMDQVSGMTDDGEVDEETVISMLPEEMQSETAPTIRECGTVRGSDNCDTAFQTHKCYYAKNPENYFLV